MTTDFQPMIFDRLTAQSERSDYLEVGASRVFAAANQGEARAPASFLTPYRVGRQWRITAGFFEGMLITGSGDVLNDLTPGSTYFVKVTVLRRDNVWFTPEPTEDIPEPEPVRYLTGSYIIREAALVAFLAGNSPVPESTLERVVEYQPLFTIGADGLPPEGAATGHLYLDPNTLTLPL